MDLQSFLTTILAVSMTVERVVEILKQMATAATAKWRIVKCAKYLFTPSTDAKTEIAPLYRVASEDRALELDGLEICLKCFA